MKTKKIYTVIWSSDRDTDEVSRFADKREANIFCFGKRHYGEAAAVTIEDVPVNIARRWGL